MSTALIVSQIFNGILTGVSGAVSGKAEEEFGEATKAMFDLRATAAEENARLLERYTREEVEQLRRDAKAQTGAAVAEIGASGLTSDSYEAIVAKRRRDAEKDALTVLLNGEFESMNQRREARMLRAQGELAQTGGELSEKATQINTISNIVGGASQTGGNIALSRGGK